jgi:DedD protein
MNSALQNRLVGTIIVVALVVILLPEWLDGEKQENTQSFAEVPPRPAELVIEQVGEFPQQTLEEQTNRPVELIDEVALDDPNNEAPEALNQAPEPEANTPKLVESTKPVVNAEPEIDIKESAWVVQLGSFRYEKNVNELIATLKNAGYRAYSQPVRTKVGVLNKVFVGPELERQKLEQALPHLQELTKLKGKITAFEVSTE